jgi:hypothetical protein
MRHHPSRINLLPVALLTATLATLGVAGVSSPAIAGVACRYRLGKSVTGSAMSVDLCSIRLIPRSFNINFAYSIDGERLNANANCRENTWYIPSDDTTHAPRSTATENMLKIVCTAPQDGSTDNPLAVVFNPPSNIRKSPNGEILCQITELRTIGISGSGPSGKWLRTNVPGCGYGYIHSSQVSFATDL